MSRSVSSVAIQRGRKGKTGGIIQKKAGSWRARKWHHQPQERGLLTSEDICLMFFLTGRWANPLQLFYVTALIGNLALEIATPCCARFAMTKTWLVVHAVLSVPYTVRKEWTQRTLRSPEIAEDSSQTNIEFFATFAVLCELCVLFSRHGIEVGGIRPRCGLPRKVGTNGG